MAETADDWEDALRHVAALRAENERLRAAGKTLTAALARHTFRGDDPVVGALVEFRAALAAAPFPPMPEEMAEQARRRGPEVPGPVDDPAELQRRLAALRAAAGELESEPVLRRGDLVAVHGDSGTETPGRVVAFGNLAGPLVVTTEAFQVDAEPAAETTSREA